MPELLQSFLDQDIRFLQVIAAFWGVPSPVDDDLAARANLAAELLKPELITELLRELPLPAESALAELQKYDGRQLWSTFTRRHGPVREFGPGKRDREQPHLHPVSAAEMLWYRGLVSRAFFKKAGQLHEYAYIPADLLELLPPPAHPVPKSAPARADSPAPQDYLPLERQDAVLDDICTALAASRIGQSLAMPHLPADPAQRDFTIQLLQAGGMLDENGQPVSETLKQHLEAPPPAAWASCFNSWERSTTSDDLRSIPDLTLQLAEFRPPQVIRQAVLKALRRQTAGAWLDVAVFCAEIQTSNPDFMRANGAFTADQVRAASTGAFIGDFTHWSEVEGAYIRYLLLGPLHWLGVTALGTLPRQEQPGVVRVTSAGQALLNGQEPRTPPENARITQKSGGIFICPPRTPRRARYLLARMAEWLPGDGASFSYRVTPAALASARQQSLHTRHLVSLLKTYAANPPSPAFVRALTHWEEQGVQAGIHPALLLQTSSPEVMQQIMRSAAARFISSQVGPTAAVIQPGAAEKLCAALLDLGLLADVKLGL